MSFSDGTSESIFWLMNSSCPQSPSPPSDFPNLTLQAQRIINNFAGSDAIPKDEDCLTLNIWTKAVACRELKSVLIFFYGGRIVPYLLGTCLLLTTIRIFNR